MRLGKRKTLDAKVRYCGLKKNMARLTMLFALDLWIARKRIVTLQG